ncbi:MAG: hypothetical protein ACLGIO_11380, partial [Acidimicrobiia bacterium]
DGEGDPTTVAHLGGCDGCLARVDALDRVRRLVAAAPGPAPPGVADRAVAAAVAAWEEQRSGRAAPPAARAGGGGRPDDTIVPLRRRPPRWAGAGREGRRGPGWAIGAVAALVAAVLVVPVLLRDSGPGERTASAPTGEAATTAEAGVDAVVDGGELGALSDPAALRRRLEQALGGDAAPAAVEARPSSGDEPTTAAPAAPSPSPAATADQDDAAARQAAGGSPPLACHDEVRSQVGDRLGPLVYAATLRWHGTDAVVLAYRLADRSGPGPDHLAFVMARDDCRVLASQGF